MVDTAPKPFIFVLMPFDKSFDDVYQLGIKKACDDAGAYAERVDEQIFDESILQRIYNQISKADVIISDMTGRNVNVFYETGYAHALGKQVILLTQHTDDIPFDLKHYPHIVYGGKIIELIPELEKRVRWAIQHIEEKMPQPKFPVEFYIGRVPLASNPTVDYNLVHPAVIPLRIDCHNSDNIVLETIRFEIAFLTSMRFSSSYWGLEKKTTQTVRPPTGGLIHLSEESISLYPGGWEKIYIDFHTSPGDSLKPGDTETIILRTLSHEGGRDFPFNIKFEKP